MSVIRPYFQPELDTARDLHLTRKEPRGEDLNGPAPHRAGSERRSRGSELVSLAANRPSPHCGIVSLTEGKEEGSPHRIRSASGRCYGIVHAVAGSHSYQQVGEPRTSCIDGTRSSRNGLCVGSPSWGVTPHPTQPLGQAWSCWRLR